MSSSSSPAAATAAPAGQLWPLETASSKEEIIPSSHRKAIEAALDKLDQEKEDETSKKDSAGVDVNTLIRRLLAHPIGAHQLSPDSAGTNIRMVELWLTTVRADKAIAELRKVVEQETQPASESATDEGSGSARPQTEGGDVELEAEKKEDEDHHAEAEAVAEERASTFSNLRQILLYRAREADLVRVRLQSLKERVAKTDGDGSLAGAFGIDMRLKLVEKMLFDIRAKYDDQVTLLDIEQKWLAAVGDTVTMFLDKSRGPEDPAVTPSSLDENALARLRDLIQSLDSNNEPELVADSSESDAKAQELQNEVRQHIFALATELSGMVESKKLACAGLKTILQNQEAGTALVCQTISELKDIISQPHGTRNIIPGEMESKLMVVEEALLDLRGDFDSKAEIVEAERGKTRSRAEAIDTYLGELSKILEASATTKGVIQKEIMTISRLRDFASALETQHTVSAKLSSDDLFSTMAEILASRKVACEGLEVIAEEQAREAARLKARLSRMGASLAGSEGEQIDDVRKGVAFAEAGVAELIAKFESIKERIAQDKQAIGGREQVADSDLEELLKVLLVSFVSVPEVSESVTRLSALSEIVILLEEQIKDFNTKSKQPTDEVTHFVGEFANLLERKKETNKGLLQMIEVQETALRLLDERFAGVKEAFSEHPEAQAVLDDSTKRMEALRTKQTYIKGLLAGDMKIMDEYGASGKSDMTTFVQLLCANPVSADDLSNSLVEQFYLVNVVAQLEYEAESLVQEYSEGDVSTDQPEDMTHLGEVEDLESSTPQQDSPPEATYSPSPAVGDGSDEIETTTDAQDVGARSATAVVSTREESEPEMTNSGEEQTQVTSADVPSRAIGGQTEVPSTGEQPMIDKESLVDSTKKVHTSLREILKDQIREAGTLKSKIATVHKAIIAASNDTNDLSNFEDKVKHAEEELEVMDETYDELRESLVADKALMRCIENQELPTNDAIALSMQLLSASSTSIADLSATFSRITSMHETVWSLEIELQAMKTKGNEPPPSKQETEHSIIENIPPLNVVVEPEGEQELPHGIVESEVEQVKDLLERLWGLQDSTIEGMDDFEARVEVTVAAVHDLQDKLVDPNDEFGIQHIKVSELSGLVSTKCDLLDTIVLLEKELHTETEKLQAQQMMAAGQEIHKLVEDKKASNTGLIEIIEKQEKEIVRLQEKLSSINQALLSRKNEGNDVGEIDIRKKLAATGLEEVQKKCNEMKEIIAADSKLLDDEGATDDLDLQGIIRLLSLSSVSMSDLRDCISRIHNIRESLLFIELQIKTSSANESSTGNSAAPQTAGSAIEKQEYISEIFAKQSEEVDQLCERLTRLQQSSERTTKTLVSDDFEQDIEILNHGIEDMQKSFSQLNAESLPSAAVLDSMSKLSDLREAITRLEVQREFDLKLAAVRDDELANDGKMSEENEMTFQTEASTVLDTNSADREPNLATDVLSQDKTQSVDSTAPATSTSRELDFSVGVAQSTIGTPLQSEDTDSTAAVASASREIDFSVGVRNSTTKSPSRKSPRSNATVENVDEFRTVAEETKKLLILQHKQTLRLQERVTDLEQSNVRGGLMNGLTRVVFFLVAFMFIMRLADEIGAAFAVVAATSMAKSVRNMFDVACGPASPGTRITPESGSISAPYWVSPASYKEAVFTALCGDRRPRVELEIRGNTLFITELESRATKAKAKSGDKNNQTGSQVTRIASSSAFVGSESIGVVDRDGWYKEIPAPWILN